MSYTYIPTYLPTNQPSNLPTLRARAYVATCTSYKYEASAWRTRERRCVSPHLPEILTRDASVSSSHERILRGPGAGEGEAVLPGSSAGALREHRESFVRAERSVHVAAARLEPPPSFPPPRSLKCQIIGRTYVRSLCLRPPLLAFHPISSPPTLPGRGWGWGWVGGWVGRSAHPVLDALIPQCGFLNRVSRFDRFFCRAFPPSLPGRPRVAPRPPDRRRENSL
jgi:hypothetical protein